MIRLPARRCPTWTRCPTESFRFFDLAERHGSDGAAPVDNALLGGGDVDKLGRNL